MYIEFKISTEFNGFYIPYIVRPIPNKIHLWKPWMYSASLYQDWLTRLTTTAAHRLEPAQFLNFPANSQDPKPGNENTMTDQVI